MHWMLALSLAALVGIACSPSEERAGIAREDIRTAIERGDRSEAVAAVARLRAALPDTPEALLEVASAMVAVGSAPDAVWRLEAGLLRHPERDDLRLAVARTSLLTANPTRAQEVVQPIAADSEFHADALLLRAQAELKLGDLDAALEVLGEAEQLYPDRPEAPLARVATLMRERRPDEARAAIEALQADLASDAGSADDRSRELRHRLALTLAQLRAQQGEPDEAIATLDAMIEADPRDALAWQALVQALVQQRRGPEALSRVEAALSGEVPLPGLLPVAAQLYEARGEGERAEEALRRYAVESESGAAWLPLVLHFSGLDDVAGAGAALEEAIARHPEDPALHLMQGETLLAGDDLAGARAALERFARTTFEGDPQVEYLEARLDLAEGRTDRAARRLRDLAPRLDRASTHFWLGRALEIQGDSEGARRRYALAQRRDPTWAAPLAALIAIAQQRGDWVSMVAHARGLMRRAPHRFESWAYLAEALTLLGDAEEAVRVAEGARARFPERPEAEHLLARALRAGGRFDASLGALDAAEQTGGAPLEAERIRTLAMAGRLEEAVALGRARVAAGPESAEVSAALAAVLYALGEAAEGDAATDRALVLEPELLQPLRVRCEFRAATGRFAGAREDCQRYLEVYPDDAGAHFMLGVARASAGDEEAAIASYRRASALDASDARPRNNLAELLGRRGDLDGALAEAQEAYRLAGDDAMVIDTLGVLYLKKGLPARAVALLERAHANAPEHPEVALNLALAYRDAGRAADARVVLARLQAPGTPEAVRSEAREVLHSLP